jgi:hypothetical protein
MVDRTKAPLALAVAAAVTVSVGWPGAAAARREPAPQETIAVLPLVIDGDLPASFRDQLQSRLTEGVARGARPVLALDPSTRCAEAPCMRDIGRTSGARWIARARVVVRDRDFDVGLELFDARDGAILTKTSGTCEVCAIAEVGDMLADQAGVLDRKLEALAHAPPSVRFESRPTGALVWLDGKLVGPTPVERTVEAGRHRARAELDDHLPLEIQFDAIAGTHETIPLELSAVPKKRLRMRNAGWGMLGVGFGLAAAGIPLLALHGRPYESRCSGDDVDDDGDCRYTYGTRTGGIVLLAIGGAAVITAVALVAAATRGGLPPRKRSARLRVHGLGVAF